ncbi:hypothetical protein ACH3XW_6395 [Acanthocheilonema viteae]
MSSQIDIQTGNEYASEELNLPKTQPILQTNQQLKTSKEAESSLLKSVMDCNEIEAGNSADELIDDSAYDPAQVITDHNDPQTVMNNRTNNSRNISNMHKQPSANVSQKKLQKLEISENSATTSHDSRKLQNFAKNDRIPLLTNGSNRLTSKYCNHYCTKGHLICSHQNFHCSEHFNASGKRHNCKQRLNVCDNVKNGVYCSNVCKRNNYKSGKIDVIHTNERGKSKEDEVIQTSHNFDNFIGHCSRPMHQQTRSKSFFIKPNAYSRKKCTCKGIYEQSNPKYRDKRLSSTINEVMARKLSASNQMLSSPNHHRKAEGCKSIIRVIAPPNYQNRPKYALKCCGCKRHIFCKYRNGRSNDIRCYSASHFHRNDRNHSSSPYHIYYCKHH